MTKPLPTKKRLDRTTRAENCSVCIHSQAPKINLLLRGGMMSLTILKQLTKMNELVPVADKFTVPYIDVMRRHAHFCLDIPRRPFGGANHSLELMPVPLPEPPLRDMDEAKIDTATILAEIDAEDIASLDAPVALNDVDIREIGRRARLALMDKIDELPAAKLADLALAAARSQAKETSGEELLGELRTSAARVFGVTRQIKQTVVPRTN